MRIEPETGLCVHHARPRKSLPPLFLPASSSFVSTRSKLTGSVAAVSSLVQLPPHVPYDAVEFTLNQLHQTEFQQALSANATACPGFNSSLVSAFPSHALAFLHPFGRRQQMGATWVLQRSASHFRSYLRYAYLFASITLLVLQSQIRVRLVKSVKSTAQRKSYPGEFNTDEKTDQMLNLAQEMTGTRIPSAW